MIRHDLIRRSFSLMRTYQNRQQLSMPFIIYPLFKWSLEQIKILLEYFFTVFFVFNYHQSPLFEKKEYENKWIAEN
jgi:hypothetical protein